jgi:hypothetical protein
MKRDRISKAELNVDGRKRAGVVKVQDLDLRRLYVTLW